MGGSGWQWPGPLFREETVSEDPLYMAWTALGAAGALVLDRSGRGSVGQACPSWPCWDLLRLAIASTLDSGPGCPLWGRPVPKAWKGLRLAAPEPSSLGD